MTASAPRLPAFAGSLREAPCNRGLIPVLAGVTRDAGARDGLIKLRDFPLPLYAGDIEAGTPGNMVAAQAPARAAPAAGTAA